LYIKSVYAYLSKSGSKKVTMAIALQLAPHVRADLTSQKMHAEPLKSAIDRWFVQAKILSTQQSLHLTRFCFKAGDRPNSLISHRRVGHSGQPTTLSEIVIIDKTTQLSLEENQL